MKQTAVEWLVDYIKNLEKYPYKTIQELEEQAKEMEKNQIGEAYEDGYSDSDNTFELNKEYFNVKFKN